MRLPSGTTDQYIYFYAVDATDGFTPETGLTGFTVYRSRNGGAPAAMTTPTINETDATNMQGVYELLVDEDTTIASGNNSEELALHITATGMAPVVRTIELYRPTATLGETIGVTSGAVDDVTLVATTTTNTDMRGTDSANTTAPDNAGISANGAAIAALNNLSAAQVNAEVDTALSDYDGPTNTEMVAAFTEIKGATWSSVTDSLEAIRDRGDAAWITGSGGDATEAKQDTIIANIGALNDLSSADVTAAVPTATQNADALLNRDMSAVTVTNSRSPINALRFLRNNWQVVSTTLTVYEEDDTTAAWTATVTANASADPITGSNPA